MSTLRTPRDSVAVDAVKLMRQVTIEIHVTRTKELRFRIWLSVQLLKIVGWLMNFKLRFDK